MLALFMLIALAFPESDAQARAKAAVALAQAESGVFTPRVRFTPGVNNYEAGAALAIATNRPLVVFLGCPQRPVAGAVVCHADTLPGYQAPAIVVALPKGDSLYWRTTLPASATDAVIRGKAVSHRRSLFTVLTIVHRGSRSGSRSASGS